MDFPQTGLIIWMILLVVAIGLPILALRSILLSNFKDSTTKLLWVVLVILAPFMGPMLYFSIGRGQRKDVVMEERG